MTETVQEPQRKDSLVVSDGLSAGGLAGNDTDKTSAGGGTGNNEVESIIDKAFDPVPLEELPNYL